MKGDDCKKKNESYALFSSTWLMGNKFNWEEQVWEMRVDKALCDV